MGKLFKGEVIVGKPRKPPKPNHYPSTRISSGELGAAIDEVCRRVNITGIPERINGLHIVPNRPKDTSAARWGCVTVLVCIVVFIVRVATL